MNDTPKSKPAPKVWGILRAREGNPLRGFEPLTFGDGTPLTFDAYSHAVEFLEDYEMLDEYIAGDLRIRKVKK